MRKTLPKTLLLLGLSFLLVGAAHGQSLGDVARQEREKQKANAGQTAPKVFTNEDLPKEGDISSIGNGAAEAAPSRALGSKSADGWKAEIAAQKQIVEDLQSRIDRLNGSIRFAPANCVRGCVQYNERQVQKQDDVQRLQQQLDEQKRKLEEMQEGARKEGFGNAVYEP